jgi:hypothetical protein
MIVTVLHRLSRQPRLNSLGTLSLLSLSKSRAPGSIVHIAKRGFFGKRGFRTRSDARINMYVGVLLGAVTGYFIFYDLIVQEIADYDDGKGVDGKGGKGEKAGSGAGAGAGAGAAAGAGVGAGAGKKIE